MDEQYEDPQADAPSEYVAMVHGYKPIGEPGDPHRQREPAGSIHISGWFDDKTNWPEGMTHTVWRQLEEAKFIREAEAILNVLTNNLPGGTLHQLLIAMLKHQMNLYVVLESPAILPDRLDIEKLAVAFVHEVGNWSVFKELNGSDGFQSSPWAALCRAVEAKYGEPPVVEIPIPDEIEQLVADFDDDKIVVKDDEGRDVTSMVASKDVVGLLLIQVYHDDAEWYLVKKEELSITPF